MMIAGLMQWWRTLRKRPLAVLRLTDQRRSPEAIAVFSKMGWDFASCVVMGDAITARATRGWNCPVWSGRDEVQIDSPLDERVHGTEFETEFKLGQWFARARWNRGVYKWMTDDDYYMIAGGKLPSDFSEFVWPPLRLEFQ